jgi:hypothetical protein
MAQLSVLRRRFVERTGRYDLVVDENAWADNGANAFINAGQYYLDRKIAHPKLSARRVVNLSIGQQLVEIRYLRRVKKVFLYDSTGMRGKLDQTTQILMSSTYPDAGTSNATRGIPRAWCYSTIGMAPEQKAEADLTGYEGVEAAIAGEHYPYQGLQIYPASDAAYTLHADCDFYSPPLTNDTDLSYWTNAENEEVLILAACYCHEISQRNMQGANDFKSAIDDMLLGIEKDIVELELPEDDQMIMWG